MPVQPPGPLEEQVNGWQLGNHQVEIDVEALLDNLGGHQYGRHWPRGLAWLAKSLQRALLSRFPFFKWETAMEEIDYRSAILGVFGHHLTTRFVNLLRAPHGITDHRRASAAGTDAFPQPRGQRSWLRWCRFEKNALPRRGGSERYGANLTTAHNS